MTSPYMAQDMLWLAASEQHMCCLLKIAGMRVGPNEARCGSVQLTKACSRCAYLAACQALCMSAAYSPSALQSVPTTSLRPLLVRCRCRCCLLLH